MSKLVRLNVGPRIAKQTDLMKDEFNKLAKKILNQSTFSNDFGDGLVNEEVAHPLRTLQYKHTAAGVYLDRIFAYYEKASLDTIGELPETFIMDLECFFYFCWGALDSLGGLFTNSLKLPLKGRHVSFIGVVLNLTGKNGKVNDPIFEQLKTDLDSGWLDRIGKYRDFVTHRGILLTQSSFTWTGGSKVKYSTCVLPDDPIAEARTYDKQIDARAYAEDCLFRLTVCARELLSYLLKDVFSKL